MFQISRNEVLHNSKPGPPRNVCIWCASDTCNHCQCLGYGTCDHAPGKQCMRKRYKRRLVCNSCEKRKLKEKRSQRTISMSSANSASFSSLESMDDGGPIVQEKRSYAGSLASLLECIDLYYNEEEENGKKSRSSSPIIKHPRVEERQSEPQIPTAPKDESNKLPIPPPLV